MDKIIERIYMMETEENPCLFVDENRERTNKEWALYNRLYNDLSQELKALFSEYANLSAERHREELKSAYEKGFKTGAKLMVESMRE